MLEVQKGYDWTGDGQLRFMPADDEPILEIEFAIEKAEYRGLILRFTYAEDYGVYRVFLDGKNVSEPADYMVGQKLADYDFYSPTLKVKETSWAASSSRRASTRCDWSASAATRSPRGGP